MSSEQLQFIFSLFSFVGVIGILFYIILDKAKEEESQERITLLEENIHSLKDYINKFEEQLKEKDVPTENNLKEKIIELYEEGKNATFIENSLNVSKAKIEMVLKFHNLKKSDNWRDSVDENL